MTDEVDGPVRPVNEPTRCPTRKLHPVTDTTPPRRRVSVWCYLLEDHEGKHRAWHPDITGEVSWEPYER